ncbi:hypothetical protein [Leptothermofonsia sp. ETS-13]|uniref:hypothetical protein n=1 Tax=Leptothermofonsia sp. ETS-13 TaxID=3035696 RepID=UPI003BA39755
MTTAYNAPYGISNFQPKGLEKMCDSCHRAIASPIFSRSRCSLSSMGTLLQQTQFQNQPRSRVFHWLVLVWLMLVTIERRKSNNIE